MTRLRIRLRMLPTWLAILATVIGVVVVVAVAHREPPAQRQPKRPRTQLRIGFAHREKPIYSKAATFTAILAKDVDDDVDTSAGGVISSAVSITAASPDVYADAVLRRHTRATPPTPDNTGLSSLLPVWAWFLLFGICWTAMVIMCNLGSDAWRRWEVREQRVSRWWREMRSGTWFRWFAAALPTARQPVAGMDEETATGRTVAGENWGGGGGSGSWRRSRVAAAAAAARAQWERVTYNRYARPAPMAGGRRLRWLVDSMRWLVNGVVLPIFGLLRLLRNNATPPAAAAATTTRINERNEGTPYMGRRNSSRRLALAAALRAELRHQHLQQQRQGPLELLDMGDAV